MGQFLQESLEFAENIDEAITNVSSHRDEKGFMQLGDDVIARLPEELNFLPIIQVEMPFLSSQAIYFRLYQTDQHGAPGTFKEGKRIG